MNGNTNRKIPYEVPFRAKFKLKKSFWIIFVISTIFLLFTAVLAFQDRDFIVSIIMILFALFFIYLILVIRKQYLEITDTYIMIYNSFVRGKSKKVYWNDIVYINLQSENFNSYIGIVTKRNIIRQKNRLTKFVDSLSHGIYSLVIPLNFLHYLDIDRLILTIKEKMDMEEIERFIKSEGLIESKDEEVNDGEDYGINLVKTVGICLLISVLAGLIYGYFLRIAKGNLFSIPTFIPIISNWLIIYIYRKNYREDKFNIFNRLIIGAISTVPLFLGLISKVYFWTKMIPNLNNLIIVIRDQIRLLIYVPFQGILFLTVVLYVFTHGTLQGKRFKIQQKLDKIFYKKYGEYYCNKNEADFNIFIVDPEDIDYDEVKYVTEFEGDFLIERNKKRPGGFYVPKELIQEGNLIFPYYNYIDAYGEPYHYIDLGNPEESGATHYHLPCIMFLKENREVVVLRVKYFKTNKKQEKN